MSRALKAWTVLLLLPLWMGLAGSSVAHNEPYQVIVHPENPTADVEVSFLRDVFLKKETNWPNGKAIRPVDLPQALPTRAQFIREVLKKTPSQLRSYWTQRIFSGTGLPPPEVDSVAAAVHYVMSNPGAVAYLPPDADPGRAKVLRVR